MSEILNSRPSHRHGTRTCPIINNENIGAVSCLKCFQQIHEWLPFFFFYSEDGVTPYFSPLHDSRDGTIFIQIKLLNTSYLELVRFPSCPLNPLYAA